MGGRGGGSPGNRGNGTSQPSSTPGYAEQQVIDAYNEVKSPNGWAKLANIREGLSGLSREAQDRAITNLADRKNIVLIPEENQKTLTQADRAAAVRYGGEPNHLIRIG